jgi:hypothetical protein
MLVTMMTNTHQKRGQKRGLSHFGTAMHACVRADIEHTNMQQP